MQDFCMAQILTYSSLWSVRSESSKYWIWQLVMSKLHEGMIFQFWYQMLNQKILKNQIFTSFFFKTLKFLYILIYYAINQHCWPFCWPNVDLFIFKRPNLKWYLTCIFNYYRIQCGVSPNLLYILKVTIIFKKRENVIFRKKLFFQESLDSPVFIFK